VKKLGYNAALPFGSASSPGRAGLVAAALFALVPATPTFAKKIPATELGAPSKAVTKEIVDAIA